jgi:TP901 family phage tail tape measure protein
MASRPIVVSIQGDDSNLKKALRDASDGVKNFGKSVAKIGAKAGVAFAATAGAIGVKGVTAFADFEKSMNEVMTLLPGAGEEVFDELSENVKGFAKEFGVLPSETIPALYQALSAGVPRTGVMEFLETAQAAAAGGVTDLETAVDGISSVMNA